MTKPNRRDNTRRPRRISDRERRTDGREPPGDVELSQSLDEANSRIASALGDTVVRHLFAVGMRMQSVQSRADDGLQDEVGELVQELDKIIREIRDLALGSDHRRSPGSRES